MKTKILITLLLIVSFYSCKKDTEVTPEIPIETGCTDCCGIQPKYSIDSLKIFFDGNSMAAGYYMLPGNIPDYTSNYPDYIHAVTGAETVNLSWSGITIWQMVSNSGPSIDMNFMTNDSITNVLIIDEGTNSLTLGANADSTYNGFVKYCLDRRAAHPNVKIVLLTPTPGNHVVTPPNFEVERQKLLQLLYQDFDVQSGCYAVRKSSQPMYADVLVDLAADSLIGYPGAENDTTYYWDKLHHTPAGYHIRGERIMTALNVLLKD